MSGRSVPKEKQNRWLSEPKQERTRKRLDAIFAAAEARFEAQGFENTTLRQVAGDVPCSMSAIYDRFESKDALLLAMHERLRQRVLSGMPLLAPDEKPAHMNLQRWVKLAVEGACSSMDHHRGLRRAIMERCISSEVVAQKERDYREELSAFFVHGLAHYGDEIRHPSPQTAARRVYSALTAIIAQRYDTRLEPKSGRLSDREFKADCVRICVGYLTL